MVPADHDVLGHFNSHTYPTSMRSCVAAKCSTGLGKGVARLDELRCSLPCRNQVPARGGLLAGMHAATQTRMIHHICVVSFA